MFLAARVAWLSVVRVVPDELPDSSFHLGVWYRANEIVLAELPYEHLSVLGALLRKSAQYCGGWASRPLLLRKTLKVFFRSLSDFTHDYCEVP